ncbi:MBL fold metallo-hydrolase [Actinomadura sp.]|uniref:MBL fold metallo-hydrolase n=1 Tax=Actinomadura sp. TaxID=1989 RepID=UPI0037C65B95
MTITVLVENQVDMLLPDQASPLGGDTHCVTRYGLIEHFDLGRVPPQAENGLSLLVDVTRGRHSMRVLFDLGLTGTVLRHNMRSLGVDPASIDHVVVSHGHPDHFGGVHEFLRLAGRRTPIATHPDAELPRYALMADGRASAVYNREFRFETVERSGGIPVLSSDSLDLGWGVRTTGVIPRRTDFEGPPPFVSGAPGLYQVGPEGDLRRDDVMDEIGLIIDVKNEGLVVLTGCAHAGVINTVNHAKDLVGDRPVRAVMGGFHLGFPTTPAENVSLTADALAELEVQTIMPMHCSGLRAHAHISQTMNANYVQPAVGSVLHFGSERR